MSRETETGTAATTRATEHTSTQESKEVDDTAGSISETLYTARDRLTENDRGRTAIQEKLSRKCGIIKDMINEMRERLLAELNTVEEKDTEPLQILINGGHGLLISKKIADNDKPQSFIEKATVSLQNVSPIR